MRCFALNETANGPHEFCGHEATVVFADQHYCGWHAEQLRKAVGGSWVYFAERLGLIKIGRSANPARRLSKLGAELLATEPGGSEREHELHLQFFDHHVAGEWFSDVPEIRHYIATAERVVAA